MNEDTLYASVWGAGFRVENFEDSRDGKGHLLPGGANDASVVHAGAEHRRCRTFTCPSA